MTTFEVAKRLRVRPQGVREFALRGELPYYRIGRRMLFAEPDVASFLGARRHAEV
jgi:excisionase family DNA binding protein